MTIAVKNQSELAEIVTSDADAASAAAIAACVVGEPEANPPLTCFLAFKPLEPSTPFSLISAQTQHPLIPMSAYPGNPYSPPVVQTPILLDNTSVVHSSRGFCTRRDCLGYPNLAPMSDSSVYLSFYPRNPPFDDVPTKAPLPRRGEGTMLSSPSTPHSSTPLSRSLSRNASHPHSLTTAKDSSPATASVTTNYDRPRGQQAVVPQEELELRGDDRLQWTGLRDGVVPFRVCGDLNLRVLTFTSLSVQ